MRVTLQAPGNRRAPAELIHPKRIQVLINDSRPEGAG